MIEKKKRKKEEKDSRQRQRKTEISAQPLAGRKLVVIEDWSIKRQIIVAIVVMVVVERRKDVGNSRKKADNDNERWEFVPSLWLGEN
jgi:hypothetical protein